MNKQANFRSLPSSARFTFKRGNDRAVYRKFGYDLAILDGDHSAQPFKLHGNTAVVRC
ncbi:hypothetical protein [Pseudomonas sp. UBA4617]|uniref:hypothetical protein n=1 Tax=Pseudomonas sp. UBA4617 TaxID=1947318 RepID=UPI0025EB48A4|nr:hypothetical protein [Pseudomonas sp. UBA4617]